MKVSELMDPKGVLLHAKIDNSADALGILVELQEGIGVITNGNAYYNAVSYRETFGGTTAIGGGIALATQVCRRRAYRPCSCATVWIGVPRTGNR